ncbi:hypothetical protein ACJJTC_016824 [Scirpophaga incertulas]
MVRPTYVEVQHWYRTGSGVAQVLHLYISRTHHAYTTPEPSEPFFSKKTNYYNGYVSDLTAEIAKVLEFNYTIKLAPSRQYGRYDDEVNTWNGLIGELIKKRADFAISDLLVTHDRSQVVDFSIPFMDFEITLLYNNNRRKSFDLYSFFLPSSFGVIAVLSISVVYIVISYCFLTSTRRLNVNFPDNNETGWSYARRFMFIVFNKKTIEGLFHFLSLIIIVIYTIKIKDFLSEENINFPIKRIEELPTQNKIKYGVMRGSTAAAFFRTTRPGNLRNISYLPTFVLPKRNNYYGKRTVQYLLPEFLNELSIEDLNNLMGSLKYKKMLKSHFIKNRTESWERAIEDAGEDWTGEKVADHKIMWQSLKLEDNNRDGLKSGERVRRPTYCQ